MILCVYRHMSSIPKPSETTSPPPKTPTTNDRTALPGLLLAHAAMGARRVLLTDR